MLTILVILGLIKLGYDQWKEDSFFKKYPFEEFEEHYQEPQDFLT